MAASSTESGFIDSWQRGKSVTECNLHMLETEDFTDVTFLVGSEKHVVLAHRYVLASRSCVFHAMFCGRMAEQGEIIIPDIEANVFKDFLKFLYTDNCTINSVNVAGLLYTSRKYDVETLFSQSATFLEESLSEENLCEVLEKSHGYRETDLEQKALKMLAEAGPKVIKSAGFPELCFGCFGSFLKSRDLNLKEEMVFQTALSWTKRVCEREGLSPSHENMRKVLGEMVYEIRFASLSLDFITNVVGPSGLLKGEERVQIMDRIINTSYDIGPFKLDSRKIIHTDEGQTSLGVNYVNRFSKIKQPSLNGRVHAISFSTNSSITLLGLQMYRPEFEETTLPNIILYVDPDGKGTNMYSTGFITECTSSNIVNDVMLPDQVSIQAGRVYHIYVELSSDVKRFSGAGGVSNVTVGSVEFSFIRRLLPPYNSSVQYGLIRGLIWKK